MIMMKIYKTSKAMCESSDKHETIYLNYAVSQARKIMTTLRKTNKPNKLQKLLL